MVEPVPPGAGVKRRRLPPRDHLPVAVHFARDAKARAPLVRLYNVAPRAAWRLELTAFRRRGVNRVIAVLGREGMRTLRDAIAEELRRK